jgi:hypothetical protein
VTHVAPTELGEISRNAFYKHSAPLALRNEGIRQQYPPRRRITYICVTDRQRISRLSFAPRRLLA